MKKKYYLIGLILLASFLAVPALAQEDEEDLDLLLDLDVQEDYQYEFPEIPTTTHLHLGYRYADQAGSAQAMEYEYLDDSVAVGAEFKVFPFPNRFFLEFDLSNKEDYFVDLRYAYGDLVLFRFLSNSLYHNLENIRLRDFDAGTSTPGIGANADAGYEYGYSAREHNFHIKAKAPRFPLHIYADGFYLTRDGDAQQRNLLGSAYFNNMQLTTGHREVDNTTRIYKVGLNSHLGLVEVDYSHTEKRFDVNGEASLSDAYTGSGFRPAGTYEHNRTPELEGSGNRLKVHSSYTGKWVASATLSQDKRENNYSGAESEMISGSGSVAWSPLTSLMFTARYSHRELDNESPATLPSGITYSYTIRQPVSTKTDTLSLTARYKPVKKLTLKAKYIFQEIDRSNAALWNLTDSTTKNSITLTADSRLHSKVLVNAMYAYHNIADPAYNTDPEHSHSGRFGLTWLPTSELSLLFSYDFKHQERDNLNFIEDSTPWYREVDQNNVRLTGIFRMSRKLSLSASYSYLDYETSQDLLYEDLGGDFQVDRNVPMEQRAHVVTFGLHFKPTDVLTLQGDVSVTRSEGKFTPAAADLLQPVSIASFSRIEQRYLLLHLGGGYKVSESLNLDVDYRFGDFEDSLSNIYDDIEDGEAHIVTVTATKKW